MQEVTTRYWKRVNSLSQFHDTKTSLRSYHVKQNLFLSLLTEAKLGYPQLGMKETVCGLSLGYEVPRRVPELLTDTWPGSALHALCTDTAWVWELPACLAQGETATQQCTAFQTLITPMTLTQWGMQTPGWEQRASPHHDIQRRPDETSLFSAVAVRIFVADRTKLLGGELSGWGFFLIF